MPLRPPYRPLYNSGLLLLLILALPAATTAAEWRYREPQILQTYDPLRFTAARDGVIWSFDGASIRRSEANGASSTPYRNALDAALGATAYIDGVATDDGGLVAQDGNCNLLRITPDQRATWRVRPPLQTCAGVRIASDGSSWIAGAHPAEGDFLYQFDSGGIQRTRRRPGANEGALLAMNRLVDFAALNGGGNLELTHSLQNSDVALLRRGPGADVLWRVELPDARQRVLRLAVAADGGADVIGTTGNIAWIARFDAGGSPVFAREIVLAASDAVLTAQRAPDAALYLVTGDARGPAAATRRLLRIGADGALAWQREYCPGEVSAPSLPPVALVTGADGGVAHLCAHPQGARLQRVSAQGNAYTIVLPFAHASDIGAGTGSELLVLGGDGPYLPLRRRLVGVAGSALRAVSLGSPQEHEALCLLAAAVDADGSSYLLSEREVADDGPRQVLTRLDAAGRVRWQTWQTVSPVREAQIEARHGLVCVSETTDQFFPGGSASPPRREAFCLRSADGSMFRQIEVAVSSAPQLVLRPLRDGRAICVRGDIAGYRIELVEENGVTRIAEGSGRLHNIGIDDEGRTTLAVDFGVRRYDVAGNLLYQIAQSPIAVYDSPFVSGADGRVYAAGSIRGPIGTTGYQLWAIAADGTTRWQAALPTGGYATTLVVSGDAVYAHAFGGAQEVSTDLTTRHADADGRRLWWHQSVDRASGPRRHGARFALSAAGDDVVLLGSGGNRLHLQRLDAADGRREIERYIDCGGLCANPAVLALDPTGKARTAFTALDPVNGQSAIAQSLGDVLRDAPATRLDQPGIAGLWHAPYANGEGLAIDWLPTSRTLFAAWFTYTRLAANDAAQQRWYTLQANAVPAGTTELELPVLQTSGGAFDAGPAVAPRAVGRARLRFSDCDQASLSYEIDSSATTSYVAGTITLSRLTPATQACVLADGSTRPGVGARPPLQGFDAGLSGAWYDERTIGQGLQLNVQPGGVFFAAWFTYDPADAANDATHQHWFTLQGDLAQAANGRAEVQLIQTVGGAFDWAPTYHVDVVGSATLSVQACDRASLDYRFGATPFAGPFAGREGRLALRRMGGCAP